MVKFVILSVPHGYVLGRDSPRSGDMRAMEAADAIFKHLLNNDVICAQHRSDKLRTVAGDYNRSRSRKSAWRKKLEWYLGLGSGDRIHIDVHSFISLINPYRPIHDENKHGIVFVGVGNKPNKLTVECLRAAADCGIETIYVNGNNDENPGESVNDIIARSEQIEKMRRSRQGEVTTAGAGEITPIMIEFNENKDILSDKKLNLFCEKLADICKNW